MTHGTIPIHLDPALEAAAEAAHQAGGGLCHACLHSAAGPVCHVSGGNSCAQEPPQFSGPQDQLQRVLAGLDKVLATPEHDAAHFVHSLRLEPGEAELTLAVSAHCAGAELADRAFQTLRGLLPDTDIYVRHAD